MVNNDKKNSIENYHHILFILNEADPYKILGVNDDCDLETINKVYRDFARKYHPDLFTHLPDKGEKKEIEQIFAKITSAFNLLKDSNARKRYDFTKKIQLKKEAEAKFASSSKQNIITSVKSRSLVQQRKVETNLNQRKCFEAETQFNLGLSLYKKNRFEEAMNNFNSAIMLDAKVAKYHSYLGLIMLKKGWNGYANAEFKVALHYDPADKIAQENYIPIEVDKNSKIYNNNKKSGVFNTLASKFFKKK